MYDSGDFERCIYKLEELQKSLKRYEEGSSEIRAKHWAEECVSLKEKFRLQGIEVDNLKLKIAQQALEIGRLLKERDGDND